MKPLFPAGNFLSAAIVSALVAASGTAGAVVLISDSFTGLGAVGFNGRTPETSAVGGNWIAPTAASNPLVGNGAGAVSANYAIGWAGFDLGTNYITNNPGVYELKLTITNPAESNTSWIGMGFSADGAATNNFVGNNGQPWLLHRLNGNSSVYGGPGIADQPINNLGSGVTGAVAGTAHTFILTLDASTANWTFTAKVDNYTFDLNGAAAGTAYDPANNPTIRYVGFSATTNTPTPGSSGTIDDFQLSFTPVPEPSVALLGLLAVPALLRRRRL